MIGDPANAARSRSFSPTIVPTTLARLPFSRTNARERRQQFQLVRQQQRRRVLISPLADVDNHQLRRASFDFDT
jgi:hypothetical protein